MEELSRSQGSVNKETREKDKANGDDRGPDQGLDPEKEEPDLIDQGQGTERGGEGPDLMTEAGTETAENSVAPDLRTEDTIQQNLQHLPTNLLALMSG